MYPKNVLKTTLLKEAKEMIDFINIKNYLLNEEGLKSYTLTRLKNEHSNLINKKTNYLKRGLSKLNKKQLNELIDTLRPVYTSRQLDVEEVKISNKARIFALRETFSEQGFFKNLSNDEIQKFLESGIIEDLIKEYGSQATFEMAEIILHNSKNEFNDIIKALSDISNKAISGDEVENLLKTSNFLINFKNLPNKNFLED